VKVQAPFGFVTGCHAGDNFMVQATLASTRHYCPEVSICLVVDDLEREYDLIAFARFRTVLGGHAEPSMSTLSKSTREMSYSSNTSLSVNVSIV
jgi:hypothetical protein